MLGTCLENVRNTVPLVHNITNYVTVNDVANILLACGGSPIMSDEPEDVEDITSICGGLNINIGTLNQRSIEGMFRAGAKANALGHVVLLDPVGAAGRPDRPRREAGGGHVQPAGARHAGAGTAGAARVFHQAFHYGRGRRQQA